MKSATDDLCRFLAADRDPSGERGSEIAWRWLEGDQGENLLISEWTDLEFASALSRKIQSGKLTPRQRGDVEGAFLTTKKQSFHRVAVDSQHYRHAEIMVRQHETGLRAGDALHLSIAYAHGASIATLDTVLASAAIYFGVPLQQPG